MTKLEKKWLNAIGELGCIACLVDNLCTPANPTPAEPHHLLDGGRRRGHLFTIPLCPPHHRAGEHNPHYTSRDQCRRRFEARYGTEESLLQRTRSLVEQKFGFTVTVT